MSDEATRTVFDFSGTTLAEADVKYEGKEYVLREASGEAAVAYQNAQIKNAKFGPDGHIVSYGNMASTQPLLLSMCLFDKTSGTPVPVQVLSRWPNKLTRQLFEWLQQNSDLIEVEDHRQQLGQLLESSDAPVSIEDLRVFAKQKNTNKVYDALVKWLAPTSEELAKNEQSDTEDGSE